MRKSIKTIARKVLQNNVSRVSIQKQLGLDLAKSSAVIDRSLEGVVAELRRLSADELRAHRLHTEIDRADTSYSKVFSDDQKRASSLVSAGAQLQALIGADGKARLSQALIDGTKVTQSQADDALGLVSPAVIDAIKTSLADGSYTNDATGLNASLKATDTSGATVSANTAATTAATTNSPASKSTGTSATVSTNTSSAYVAGSTAVAQPEPSWLKRFGLPLLLLGALVLGSVKFCGNAEKSRVVAEERDQLQLNLVGAEEQNAKTSEELTTLQANYGESQSKVESLEGDLQSAQSEFQTLTTEHEQLKEEFVAVQDEVELNTAEINLLRNDLGASNTELEQLRDLPTDAAGLQQQVVDTMHERDDAIAAEAEVLEKLKTVEAKRDQTQELNESLKFDIDTAQKNITSNATLITGFRSQVDELSVQRDGIDAELKTTSKSLEEEKANVVRLTKEVGELEERVTEMTTTAEQLDAEIVSLTKQKKDLESNLQTTQTSLDSERDERQSENSNFTTEVSSLQDKLASLTSQSDTTNDTLAERDNEIAKQSAAISELQQQVETLEADKAQSAESKELLEKDRDELLASIDELNKQTDLLASDKDSAISESESKASENTQLESELQSLKDQSSEEITALTQSNEELNAELTEAVALNDSLKDNLDLQKKKNENLESASVAIRRSVSEFEEELAKLADARDKLQAEVTATSAVSKALEGETTRVRQAIAEKLTAAGFEDVQVESIDSNRAVAVTLGSNILFSAGDVSMSQQGAKVLREVGRAISDYPDWRIDVQGHTDSLPIGERLSVFYPSNWELSSARASAVINHLRFASGIKADSMSARGFADTQPVAENTSAQGREKNRRVDIVLRR